MVASPSAYDPIQHPVAAKRRRDLVLLRMLEQGFLVRSQYDERLAQALPAQRRPELPGGGHGLPVLHLLDQAAGRRPARRRPGGRAARLRGRPAVTDDDRLAAPEGGREGDQQLAPEQVAARAPRSSRSPTRTAWCARWSAATTTTPPPFNLATQGQRQPGSSFKPFVLAEALRQNISPQSTWTSQEEDLHPQGRRALHRQQLRGRLRRRAHARRRDDVLRQRRLRPGRQEGRDQEDRAARAPAWASARRSRPTSRSRSAGSARRDAARHGARLRDLRDRRQAHLRLALARPERQELPVPGPGRDRAHRPGHAARSQGGRARRRHADGQQAQDARACLKPEIAYQVGSILQTVIKERQRRPARRSRA